MPTTGPERTGWRDEVLSAVHRNSGYDLPMTDIDFLVEEYDRALPVALIEYKHLAAKIHIWLKSTNYRALRVLADRATIPFVVCRYTDGCTHVMPIAANDLAVRWLGTPLLEPPARMLTWEQWLELLYQVRRRKSPDDVPERVR